MIDPRELRIGNTILCNGKELTVAINTIQEIIQYRIKPPEIRKDKWEAIPLTHEWLERFGFEITKGPVIDFYHTDIGRNRHFSVTVQSGNQYITLSERSVWDPTDLSDPLVLFNGDYDGKLHVHQLQNLYFALTGRELTLKDTP